MSERKRNPFSRSPCKVCRHPDRALIEQGRILGVSLDALAARHDVSRDSIHRHMVNHVDDELRASYISQVPLAELAAKAAEENLSLLEYLAIVRGLLMREAQVAALAHDRHGLATVSGRLLESLRQIGGLTGEIARLAPGTVNIGSINFIGSPAFLALHEMLLRKLAGYPEALAAVLAGLGELEAMAAADAAKPVPPMIEHAGAVA